MKIAERVIREPCLLRKAIRELLLKNPEGLTKKEICTYLIVHSKYAGTRRNLESQTSSIIQALADEKKIEIKDRRIFVLLHQN